MSPLGHRKNNTNIVTLVKINSTDSELHNHTTKTNTQRYTPTHTQVHKRIHPYTNQIQTQSVLMKAFQNVSYLFLYSIVGLSGYPLIIKLKKEKD